MGDKTRKTQGPNNLQWDREPLANFFYKWPNKYFQLYGPNSLFQVFNSTFAAKEQPQAKPKQIGGGGRSFGVRATLCSPLCQRTSESWDLRMCCCGTGNQACAAVRTLPLPPPRRGVQGVTLTLCNGFLLLSYQKVPKTINTRGKAVIIKQSN